MRTLRNDNLKSIINWLEFNVEELRARLIMCRTDDSYIKGALKASKDLSDNLDKILKLWKKTKDNPAKFIVASMDILDQSKAGTMPKKVNGRRGLISH